MKYLRWQSAAILLGAAGAEYALWHLVARLLDGPRNEADAPLVIACLVGILVIPVVGYIFGVGGLLATFGTETDVKGRFKIRKNLIARLFLPKVSSEYDTSWCEVSFGTAGRLFLKVVGAALVTAAAFLIWNLAWSEPMLLAKVVGGAVATAVFMLSLVYASAGTGTPQKAGSFVLMLSLLSAFVFGLSFIPWANMYETTAATAPTVAMHPVTLVIASVVCAIIGFALLMRNEKINSTVCPRTRAEKKTEQTASS